MNTCRPITAEEAKALVSNQHGKHAIRNRCLIAMLCFTGYRISELLKLRIKDVIDIDGNIPSELSISAQYTKRNKTRKVRIFDACQPLIIEHVNHRAAQHTNHKDLFLFTKNDLSPINRQISWRVIYKTKKLLGLNGCVANHSCRKFFDGK